MINIGGNIGDMYVGSTKIAEAYVGNQLVYKASSIPYIDWIKSLGCICWLPLASNGDLEDRISGVSLQTTGYGSLTWDSSASMYKIKTSNALGRYTAYLDNGMTPSSFPDDCFTTLSCFKKITTSGNYPSEQLSLPSKNTNTIAAMCPMYNGTSTISNYPTTLIKLSTYVGPEGRMITQNGTLYREPAAYAAYLPSNWVVIGDGLALGIVRESNSVYYNKEYYTKDIYIFTKKLSLAVIRQIQGYDPLPSGVVR